VLKKKLSRLSPDEVARIKSPRERIAMAFHESLDRLAPSFGHENRLETRQRWYEVPPSYRNLLMAVVADLLADRVIAFEQPDLSEIAMESRVQGDAVMHLEARVAELEDRVKRLARVANHSCDADSECIACDQEDDDRERMSS
jgi:hypothetical protein